MNLSREKEVVFQEVLEPVNMKKSFLIRTLTEKMVFQEVLEPPNMKKSFLMIRTLTEMMNWIFPRELS